MCLICALLGGIVGAGSTLAIHGVVNFLAEESGLSTIFQGNRPSSKIEIQQIDTGKLCQYPESLSCGEHSFKLDEITDMSMVKRNILLFTVGENYYEIRSENSCCMRKYIAAWKRFSGK